MSDTAREVVGLVATIGLVAVAYGIQQAYLIARDRHRARSLGLGRLRTPPSHVTRLELEELGR